MGVLQWLLPRTRVLQSFAVPVFLVTRRLRSLCIPNFMKINRPNSEDKSNDWLLLR